MLQAAALAARHGEALPELRIPERRAHEHSRTFARTLDDDRHEEDHSARSWSSTS